jgi:hypothetical protein
VTAAGLGTARGRRNRELVNQVAALRERVAELVGDLEAAHRAIAEVLTPNLPEVRRPTTLIPYHRQRRRSPER